MVKVYLVRHCQTEGNLQRIFQGGIDTPPSKKGLEQLDLLAIRFRNTKLDKIYSSPIGRAMKTAESINQFHNLKINEVYDLREITVGKMDGMNWDDVPVNYPEAATKWNLCPGEFEAPDGDKMTEVYDRISKAFEQIISETNDGEDIVIVSHGCALRNLNCYLLGKPISELVDVDIGVNTAVSIWEVDKCSGEKKNIALNNGAHLPDWDPDFQRKVNFNLDLIPEGKR